MENRARFDDARIDDAVADAKSVPSHSHQPRVPQKREVLGDIRFPGPERLHDLLDGKLLELEEVQNLKTLRIRQNL